MNSSSGKKKILICCNVYPPKFVGGAELIAHEQAKTFQNFGHKVQVFAGYGSEEDRYVLHQDTYDGIIVNRVNLGYQDYSSDFVNFSHPAVEKHFEKILEDFKPEIVHFHNIIGLSVRLIHLAKKRGIKTVMTLHDHWGFCYKNTLLKKDAEICIDHSRCAECMDCISNEYGRTIPIRMRKDFLAYQFQEIDLFISPSSYMAEKYIKSMGLDREKFHILWNGIDVERFSKIPKKTDKSIINFSFIGYFGKHKGIDVILEAASIMVSKNHRNFQINLVGDGDQMAHLKEKTAKLKLEKLVKFWGKIDPDKISDVYRQTDVQLLTSIWPENQPVTITEAMALSIPTIASNIGGIPELVENGKSGYLFEIGNSGALAEKMIDFIDHPEKIEMFGKIAHDKIRDKSLEKQMTKLAKLYNEKTDANSKENSSKSLIVCLGQKLSRPCSEALNEFCKKDESHNFVFLMREWLDDDQLPQAKIFWITNLQTSFEDVIIALKYRAPLIVPEENMDLQQLCLRANCGLYYSNSFEAEACLKFLAQNPATARQLGERGHNLIKI